MRHEDSIISSPRASLEADLPLGQQPALTENFKGWGESKLTFELISITTAFVELEPPVGAEPARQVLSICPGSSALEGRESWSLNWNQKISLRHCIKQVGNA